MPGAPRFTQKPSIQQTPQGDLLMECYLEADPEPSIAWHHSGNPISASSRVLLTLNNIGGSAYKANLVIKDPNVGDGGTYKCTANNQLGESNANINLNFAGSGDEASSKGPTFLSKPRIVPKEEGALVLLECRVKSTSQPTVSWFKDGVPVQEGALCRIQLTDLGDASYLCVLEIHNPTVAEAGQYRCNIRNDQGETNANLALNFEQEVEDEQPDHGRKSPRASSRQRTPRRGLKSREGTPKKSLKSREGTPKKSVRSRTATPTDDVEKGNGDGSEAKKQKVDSIDIDPLSQKRKGSASPSALTEKKRRDKSASPRPDGSSQKVARSKSPRPKSSRSKSKSPTFRELSDEKAPAIIEHLNSKTTLEGETALLKCEWKCSSSTKVSWLRNGQKVDSLPDYKAEFNGCISKLTIAKMTKSKCGLYKCVARNEYGESESSATVDMQTEKESVKDNDEEQKLAKKSPSTGKTGKSAEKDVHRSKANGSTIDELVKKNSQKPTIDLQSVEPDEKFKAIPDDISSRKSVQPSVIDDTDEESMAMDDIPSSGLVIPENIRAKLIGQGTRSALGDSDDEVTESISELPDMSISGAKSKRHKSPALSDPNTLNPVKKTGKKIRRRSSVDMRQENFRELIDKPSTPLESVGSAGPPHIVEIPENVTAAEGETAVVKCLIQGNPAPTFKWVKNREITPGGRIKFSTDRDNGAIILIIQKCRPDDDGPYTLEIKNSHGIDSAVVKILVTASEPGLDLRATLKHRGLSESSAPTRQDSLFAKDGKSISEVERRMSLFPGKRVEKWEVPLMDKAVKQQVDKTCELKCTYSRSNAKIRWYKDKKEIFSGGLKYKVVIEKSICKLIINNPEVEDSGKYTCEANGVPTTAMLTVEEPPMKYNFVNPLPNTQEIYRTKQGVLTCKVNTKRAPLVWHCNGEPISENDQKYILESDAVGRFTITIKEVVQKDQGEWMAKITNDVFSKVQVYVEEPRHTFVIPMKSQKVSESELATFECDVNDKDAEVEWFHDAVKIKVDGKKFVAEAMNRKRRLIINGASLEDHGEYKCTTKDDQTLGQLIVEALNRFIVKLKDVEVVEKEDVDLRCETKDTRTPGVWSKSGKIISSMPGGKYETTSRSGVHTLKISKIEINEGEKYEINVGGLEGSCYITVLEAEKRPVLDWKSKKIEMEAGKQKVIKIPFSVKGSRRGDPKVALLRDGKPVDLEKLKGVIEIVINGDVAEIIFKDPKVEDSGKWGLSLTNSGGTAVAPFELFVKDKPKPPNGPLETKNISSKGCDLKWSAPEPQESVPLKGYVVEMQEKDGQWVKIGETKGTDFQVQNLKENGQYRFRVKAVNEIGESEPLTSDSIVAKDQCSAPAKPKNMEAVEISKDSLTLQWQSPDNDGGAPIESYIVERRDKSEKNWEEAGIVPAEPGKSVYSLVDNNVMEGKEYYFRVKAKNKAGPGDPCDHRRPFKIVAKPEPPAFPGGGINDLRIKVGETIKYDVAISGEPTPNVSWIVNGKPLKADASCKMTTEHTKHVLKINNAKRGNSGQYRIKLKNASGECESTANVTVVSGPAPPKGPLDVFDISGYGATLEWHPPDDDGGEPLLEYIVEAQNLDSGDSFLPVGKVPANETKFNVSGLKNMNNYKFRIKAVNKEGQSDPLTSEQAVEIRDPWDEPGKPSRPQITDYDTDHINLAWNPPSNDGGAPIEEYIVEKKDAVTKSWVECGRSPTANASINGLKEGSEYQFRVKAVNKGGAGQPSEPSERQVAKSKFVPAWLKHEALKSITVKAGQSVCWDVAIGGQPIPEVKWFKGDKLLESNELYQIDVKKNVETIFCIHSASRSDCGTYKLKVKNLKGEDQETADLTVLDKPSIPRGPLQVADVFESNCNLEWKAPDDSGGEPIDFYEVEMMDSHTGRWMHCAKVKDTKAHVDNLKKGSSYQFRVKAVNRQGASEPLTTQNATLAKNPYDEPGMTSAPEITDWDSDRVNLAWNPPTDDGGAPISDYIIEKRAKHSRDWTECGKTNGPKCEAEIRDLKEGEEYQFRIRAVNKAGPGQPSDPSRKVAAKPRNMKPRIDRSAMKSVTIKVGQNYEFDVPVSGEPPPQLTWVFNDKPLQRDPRTDVMVEDYHTKLSISDAKRCHCGVYTLEASNTNGKDTNSVELIVIGRPAIPEGPLEVSDIHDDHMNLEWKPPLDDGGCPIDHYEVEKMDAATGRWVPCGKVQDTKTTVQNLLPGKTYQFRVKAVNKEGESDPLPTEGEGFLAKNPYDVPGKVKKPELVDWDKDHVDLKWDWPVDGGSPIQEFIIERKDKHGRWEEALTVPGGQTNSTVGNLKEGGEYQFRVIAKNKAGLSEPSDPSDRVIAKCRRLAPHIHREDIEDIKVKVGQLVKLNIHIDGEPAPKVMWMCNDSSLHPDTKIDDVDYLTKFSIAKAIRKQSGKYTITASNEYGRDSATFDIAIKGKPGKPKGPLDVSSIFDDRATLQWKPPDDDGGDAIDHYEIERMDTKDGVWVPYGRAKGTEFLADGLTKDRHYKFRVKAVNGEGCSEPLETEKTIQAKNPFDKPGKPGKPVPVDWDNDHADLEWTKPTSDGGASIEKYIVEKRDRFGRWQPAVEVSGDATSVTVPNLTAGEEYEFRIIAVNKGGESDPSDPSQPVIAKPRNLAPKIDRNALQSIKIKAGQVVNFDVPVEGEPPPTISWFMPDGREIKHGGRIRLDNSDYRTILKIKNTERCDSGRFTIRAVNINGEDTAPVEVNIIDKPSPPEGPLEISDIYADHVTLEWKPPLDDGGTPIEKYMIEKFDAATGHWVPCTTVDLGKTAAVVDGLIQGHEYKFRVTAVNSEGESEPLETTGAILAKNPYDPPGKTSKPEITDWDKDRVDLKWNPPISDGGAPIETYIIEMKEKYASSWVPVNEVPGDQLATSILQLKEGKEYMFRILAKNKAGPGQPSDPSDSIVAKPRHLAPHIDRNAIEEIRVRAGTDFKLNIPVSGEPPPEILWTFDGELVESSDRMKVASIDYRTKFTVKRALRSDTGTYLITAKNESGVDTAEVKVTVFDRPGDPEGPLQTSGVNKNGCKLNWKVPKDDGGAEISHYIIEKQDTQTSRWVSCGEATGTSLNITDLSPGHEYKFRVRACNKYGESDNLECQSPIIAKDPYDTADKPGTPEILDWDRDHVDLKWAPPLSDGGAPIEKYIIEKKMANGNWEYAEEVPADQTTATVGHLKPSSTYQFRVKAVNKAGSSTPSDPSISVVAKPRHLPPKIDRKTLFEVRIKAGEIIEFKVGVEGEPNPKISWFINDSPLISSSHTKIDNSTENKTILKTINAVRNDHGTYKILAVNESGKDEAEVNVIVLDVPSVPNGPLDVQDISKDGCKLIWKKPDDDGGSPITHYMVEKQEANGRWVPCGETSDTSLRLNKLTEGQTYKFRIKAVNRQGQSEPLTSLSPIVAKNPFDQPGKPTDLHAVDWDKEYVELEWKPPMTDGGAPIGSYIIEKKDEFGKWEPCATVDGSVTKGRASNLITGKSYQFRVRAVNKGGTGEPSDSTGDIVVRPKSLAPKINLAGLLDLRILAGTPIHLNVDYDGEPLPKVSWKINDASIRDDRVGITSKGKHSEVHILSSIRSDSGTYSIIAENEHGRDKASCMITVLDVPGSPKGPVKIEKVNKEGCILLWNPPLDDGGSDIINYVVEKMDTSRGVWQEVGKFPDCSAKVHKLVEGKEYQFRIKAVNMQGESIPLESESMVAKNQFDLPKPPSRPEITDYDADRIDIEWKPPTDNGGSPIKSYIIEKKEKGSTIWAEVGRTSGAKTFFSVAGLKPGTEYEFRVLAVNETGPSDPSEPSDSQVARARYLKPEIITQQRKYKIKAGLSLTVEAEFIGSPDPTVDWVFNENESLPTQLIVTSKVGLTTIFLPSAKRSECGNYTLQLKNEFGEATGVFEVNVQDRPGSPIGPIEVSDVTKESCVLRWQPPKDDGGAEVTNYVVEKRDIRSNAWTPVSGFVTGTSVIVPKLQEGHEYEFRVMAENINGRSDPLSTENPVVARDAFGTPGKPGRPIIVDTDVDQIEIEWTPPNDDGGNPISHYDIEHKDLKTGRWTKINSAPVKSTKYVDDRVQEGHLYEYRVIAVNKAGPSRPSNPSDAAIAKPMFQAPAFMLDINGKEFRTRVGEPLNITIPYIGSPIPEIKWIKCGQELPQVKTDDVKTSLHIPSCQKSDSGMCKIIAKNPNGTLEAEVKISVLDRPSPPEGPIAYIETSKRTVTLSWKPPKDNGGSEIIGYRVEYQQLGTTSWEKALDNVVSTLYTVKSLEHGKEYRFRVRAENMIGVSDALDGLPVVVRDSFNTPGSPSTPDVVKYDSCSVSLKWNAPRDDGGSPITGYVVEKFEKKGGGDWAPVKGALIRGTDVVVPGLAEGETYQFRVRAVNAAGEGAPSNGSAPVLCQPYIVQPDAPDQPHVGKVTKYSAEITWKRPIRDGGAPIDGYIVERRKLGNTEWLPCNEKLVRETCLVVEPLVENDQYEFRVKAVNSAGEGAPSQKTDTVTIQEQPGLPCLDLSGLRDIIVKAGETIEIKIPYSGGNPKPTAEVFNRNKEIYDGDRTKIEVGPDFVKLVTTTSKRSDGGPYRISLANRFGKDSGKLNVHVLDVPGKPTGPISATDISGDAVTLHWSAPLDDGGSSISNYVVEKKGPNGIWEKVGQPTSTSFRVRHLDNGQAYEFRISAENQYGVGNPTQTTDKIVAKNPFDVPGPPGQPESILTTDDAITLEWMRPLRDGGAPVTGYVLEKREEGTKEWSKCVYGPFNDIQYKVTGLKARKRYEFRVAAINAAGQGEYSENSVPITAQYEVSRPRVLPSLLSHDVIAIAGTPAKILIPFSSSPAPEVTWKKNGSQIGEKDERSKIESNDYLTQLSYEKCERGDSGTYSVKLENDAGSDSVDIRFIVVDKPEAPRNLSASDLSPESCSLSWDPPRDDGGSPITNYIVERCHIKPGAEQTWEKASSFVRGTSYDVRGLIENEKYKFRVRAENQYGMSDPAEIPDEIIAKYEFKVPHQPNAPRIREMDNTWAVLEWDLPSDGGSKILGYNVQYKEASSNKWIPASAQPVPGEQLRIKNLREKGDYEFRVIARNAAGLSKPSEPSRATLAPKFAPPGPPTQVNAASIGRNYVTLTWIPPLDDGGSKINGYIVEVRSISSPIWREVSDYNVMQPEFTVPNLVEFRDYEFRIIAVNKIGKSLPSLPTSPIKICEMGSCKPLIVVKPADIISPYNRRAVFTCEAIGRPEPSARWLRNGREIPEGARYRTEVQDDVFRLIIREVWDIDSGEYTCEVSNAFGSDSASANLTVQAPPVIEKDIGSALHADGELVRLKIYFSGTGPFRYKLTLNKEEITANHATIHFVEFENHAIITIPSIHSREAGRYELTISNDSGEANTSFWLNVTGLPSAPQGPLVISDVNRTQAMLSWKPVVNDGGARLLGYMIEKKDSTKEEWTEAAAMMKDISHLLTGLFEDHEYLFRVSAINQNGQGPPLVSDDPIIARLPFYPPSVPGKLEVTHMEDDYAILNWDRSNSDGGDRIRGYLISKREVSSDIWLKCNHIPVHSTNYKANCLIENRDYEFRVSAVNDAGISEYSLCEVFKFLPSTSNDAPQIIDPLFNTSCEQGRSVTLRCSLKGTPAPECRWFKGTKEIISTSKYTIMNRELSQALMINDFQAEDVDEYTCRATNSSGIRVTKCQLSMHSKPKVYIPPKYQGTYEAEIGTDIEFLIPFKGSPLSSSYVTKNNERISNSDRYQISVNEKVIVLRISKVSRADNEGTYQFVIENSLGSKSGCIDLKIIGPPDLPRQPVVDNILGESAVMSWKSPESDGGAFISSYFVQKKGADGNWIKCGTARYTCMTVNGLEQKQTYQFRVLAENKHGLSEPSEPTASVTIPEARTRQIDGHIAKSKSDYNYSDPSQYRYDEKLAPIQRTPRSTSYSRLTYGNDTAHRSSSRTSTGYRHSRFI